MWYCGECGKKNSGKFCTRCGTRHIDAEEELSLDRIGVLTDDDNAEPTEADNAAAMFRRNSVKVDFPASSPLEATNREEPSAKKIPAPQAAPLPIAEAPPEATGENRSEKALPKTKGHLGSESQSPVEPQSEEVTSAQSGSIEYISAAPEDSEDATLWSAPFLHQTDALAEKDNGSAEYLRSRDAAPEESSEEEEAPSTSAIGIAGIFSHRKPPENNADREWKYSKRLLMSVGSVGGVLCLAVLILVVSLLINLSGEEEALPVSTGIYYYVSGAEDTLPLYADKSIRSDVLGSLKNGDPVEFLDKVNAKFTLVYDDASEQYGYVNTANLVKHKSDVDYGKVENQYANEKSLGYFYVTKVEEYLSLWENSDGGGVVKAKLENGFKISLLEKTNDSYWYVFDYNSAERGYVRTAYLTDSKSKVVYPYKEPEDKTVIGEYYVTGVQKYLPIYAKPRINSDLRGKLYNGDKVGLIEKTTGSFWYVGGNGAYGWVSAKYLTETPPTPAPAPAPEAPAANDYKVTNTNEFLPVLSEPKIGGNEIGQIHNGDTVTFISEYDAKFWYVKVPSLNIEGYVAKDYLTK